MAGKTIVVGISGASGAVYAQRLLQLLALDDCVQMVATRDGINAEAARQVALDHMVPGVILQPSGVFAAVRCQEAGCTYVKSS